MQNELELTHLPRRFDLCSCYLTASLLHPPLAAKPNQNIVASRNRLPPYPPTLSATKSSTTTLFNLFTSVVRARQERSSSRFRPWIGSCSLRGRGEGEVGFVGDEEEMSVWGTGNGRTGEKKVYLRCELHLMHLSSPLR